MLDATIEFERQVRNLTDKGYPKLAQVTEAEFLKLIPPFKDSLSELKPPDFESGYLPFVIVVKSELVSAGKQMGAVRFNDRPGAVRLSPLEPEDFHINRETAIPDSLVYILLDIDRGKDTINTTPENALKIIQGKHRFPLTIDEGIAVITHYPQFLIKNNCFSLLASRTGKDQRVPAIWINSNKQANLGWCWERNPHTWLGSASAKLRIA